MTEADREAMVGVGQHLLRLRFEKDPAERKRLWREIEGFAREAAEGR